jgi:hypothetical protein
MMYNKNTWYAKNREKSIVKANSYYKRHKRKILNRMKKKSLKLKLKLRVIKDQNKLTKIENLKKEKIKLLILTKINLEKNLVELIYSNP